MTEPPAANLWAWWKADSIPGLADGDPVSAWPDSGPAGRSLSQSGTLRPTFRAAAIAGRPAVEFDGVDDFLAIANPGVLATAHVFLVATVSDSAGDKTVLGGTAGAFNFNFQSAERPLISSYGFTSVAGTVAPSLDAWFQMSVSLAGSLAVEHRLSRSANGSGSLGSAPNAATIRVGDVGAFGPRSFKGRIAELLIYSIPQVAGDVEAYLNYRFGV